MRGLLPGDVGADADEILAVAHRRHPVAHPARLQAVLDRRDVGHRPADAGQDVDRRDSDCARPRSRDSTMWPSRMRAHGVGDRLVGVVAFDEHGVEAGDAALAADVAGALEQARQQREHRRRIALRGRRLAGGEPDLALRHREARDRVHHQQDVLPLLAEVLGDRVAA